MPKLSAALQPLFAALACCALLALAAPSGNAATDAAGAPKAAAGGSTKADDNPGDAAGTVRPIIDSAQIVARLSDLRQRIADKKAELEALRAVIRGVPRDLIDAEQQKLLEKLPEQLNALRDSFEQMAVSGIDMSVFSQDETKKYEWESELLEIVKPVLGSLKELTEKPRRVEAMRREIERTRKQQAVIDSALLSIGSLLQVKPADPLGSQLTELQSSWEQRRAEAANNLQMYKVQLATLEGQQVSNWEAYIEPVWEFTVGRGLTLLIALGVATLVWLFTRAVLWLILRVRPDTRSRRNRRSRERALRYLNRMFTASLIFVSTLIVFYARSDMLLLALSMILMVMTLASLRQAVPKYLEEIRLLLDFGSVREGERLVYAGLPMRVMNIHAFATLCNPELDGMVRVSLDKLVGMHSRPVTEESWFPCRPGELLMLDGDRFAEVVHQSVDLVQLRMRASMVQMPSAQLFAMAPRNLSREGFLVTLTFGIDYRHQKICLDEIPWKMHEVLERDLRDQEYGEHCTSVAVEFSAAAANSLDYLVMARFEGAAAGNFFAIGRLIQRSLVGLCNREGWTIPFGQLTIHGGDGFAMAAPAIAPVEGKRPVDDLQASPGLRAGGGPAGSEVGARIEQHEFAGSRAGAGDEPDDRVGNVLGRAGSGQRT